MLPRYHMRAHTFEVSKNERMDDSTSAETAEMERAQGWLHILGLSSTPSCVMEILNTTGTHSQFLGGRDNAGSASRK
jgi:hypothetical protein